MRTVPPAETITRRQRIAPAGWHAPPLGLVISRRVIVAEPSELAVTPPSGVKVTMVAAPGVAAIWALGEPSTIATAIRIGNPASWTKAVDARDQSGGLIEAVTDREILAAYRMLARQVGVFVELGSAASVAGLLQQAEAGMVPAGATVVCTVTGHGLKDPEWAISTAPSPTTIKNDVIAAAQALDLA